MGEHLRVMTEEMEDIARRLKILPVRDAVRGYLYPDCRAIVRLRFAAPPRKDPDDVLFDVSEEFGPWKPDRYGRGPWFEASLVFHPEDGRKYASRIMNGLQQIQTFATRSAPRLFETLRLVVWPKLKSLGYPPPLAYVFRASRAPDNMRPFMKKDPPE